MQIYTDINIHRACHLNFKAIFYLQYVIALKTIRLLLPVTISILAYCEGINIMTANMHSELSNTTFLPTFV